MYISTIVAFVILPPSAILADPPGSPLDRLEAKTISPAQRFSGQPRELVAVLGEPRESSDGAVLVAFSPDGKRLAFGEELWDLSGAEPKRQATLTGRRVLAFAPDGKTLAVVGPKLTLDLWDLAGTQPTEQTVLQAHFRSHRYPAAFAPDGKTLAAGSSIQDNTLRLWDLKATGPTERAILPYPGGQPKQRVHSVAISPDGKTLAAGARFRTIALWDFGGTEPKLREVLSGHKHGIWVLAFAPDGTTLASGSRDRTVRLWDLSQAPAKQKLELAHQGEAHGVAFAPDGKTLATSSLAGELIVWEAATGKKLSEWRLPGVLRRVAFAPDGRHLAVAHGNGTLFILRLAASTDAPGQ